MNEGRGEAHGRVNLIGEHTDYNGGFVMPAAIPQTTIVDFRKRDDCLIHVRSASQPGSIEYKQGEEKRTGMWTDYIQGVTRALAAAGHSIGGMDAGVVSTVPVAAGLSSSAALEISFLRALRAAFDLPLSDLDMAKLAQKAENEFVGAPVGILDQMACTFADAGTALFLDTASLAFDRLPIPAGVQVSVLDSGIRHDNRLGDYGKRRAECEEAARMLGVARLRDLGIADLSLTDRLPDPLFKRARHVVTENDRVLKAADAIRSGDVAALGRLFLESHASMRDDFEISLPEIDLLVQLAAAREGVYGARLTGGGFGGAVVVLVDSRFGEAGGPAIEEYIRRTGRPGRLLV